MSASESHCRSVGFASDVPAPIAQFLERPSDPRWAVALAADLQSLLVDHANCELKAANTALALMHRYAERDTLVWRMSRLAREELRHYEQVRKLMRSLGIAWVSLGASDYASGLRAAVTGEEPLRLIDTLIVGALIEARSCERFALLVPHLPAPVAGLYSGLLASEARHFEHYLALASEVAGDLDVGARIARLRTTEQELVSTPATELRFHSGPPH